jgi:hypothetical protein
MNMRLTAGRSAAGAVLLAISVSACTAGGGSSIPATFTPSPATAPSSAPGGSRTPSPNQGSTGSEHPSATSKGAGAGKTSAPARSATPAKSSDPATTKARSSTPAKTAAPAKKAHASASPTLARIPVTSPPAYPTAAPETGGGGTAGLQDGFLFGAGGAAILVGLASLAYRRRLARNGRPAD